MSRLYVSAVNGARTKASNTQRRVFMPLSSYKLLSGKSDPLLASYLLNDGSGSWVCWPIEIHSLSKEISL